MPSPRAPTYKKPKPALPPRARELAELIAVEGLSLKDGAVRMGIGYNTARTYFRLPAFNGYRLQCLAEVRNGEQGRNLKVAINLRDEGAKEPSAAHKRVAIEAMRFIEDRDGPANVNVNVGVGVQNITPGYRIVVPEEYYAKARDILRRSGSTTNALDDDGLEHELVRSQARVIEHDEAETAQGSESAPATPGGPEFGKRRFEEFPPHDSRLRSKP